MRKLVGLIVGIGLVISLASCGSSLTAQETKAINGVEANVTALVGKTTYGAPVVEAVINTDSAGNKVTFANVVATDSQGKKFDLLLIVVENKKGQLVFADVALPSGLVTVTGPGYK